LTAAPVRGAVMAAAREILAVGFKVDQVGRPGQWQSQSRSQS
jgi:hypothetical protein